MPTYSYRCTECGHAFDIVQSFSEDSLAECPSCGGRLRKLFSPVGIAFKGSGFYRTDSQSSGAASSGSKAAPSESSPASAPATSPTGSSGAATGAAGS